MVSLSFSSCNKDKDQKVSNSERLIGEWIYRTTQVENIKSLDPLL